MFSKAKKAESSPNVEPSDEGNSRGHSAGEWMLRKLQQVQGGMEPVIWVSILFHSDPEIHVPNLPQGNILLSVGISWMCLINCGLMGLQTKSSVALLHKAIFILPQPQHHFQFWERLILSLALKSILLQPQTSLISTKLNSPGLTSGLFAHCFSCTSDSGCLRQGQGEPLSSSSSDTACRKETSEAPCTRLRTESVHTLASVHVLSSVFLLPSRSQDLGFRSEWKRSYASGWLCV